MSNTPPKYYLQIFRAFQIVECRLWRQIHSFEHGDIFGLSMPLWGGCYEEESAHCGVCLGHHCAQLERGFDLIAICENSIC